MLDLTIGYAVGIRRWFPDVGLPIEITLAMIVHQSVRSDQCPTNEISPYTEPQPKQGWHSFAPVEVTKPLPDYRFRDRFRLQVETAPTL